MFLELLGRSSNAPVTRTNALSVPAVQRGRNMICSIATLPLEQRGPDNSVVPSPLLAQLDPDVPNVVTLSQTVEDLLFDSISWWLVTAQDFAGFPVAVRHLDVGSVSVNPPAGRNPAPLPSGIDPRQAVVWVDGKPIPHSRVIRFDSPNPGVLKVGGRAIRRAIALDQAANMYADDPRPLDYFTPGEGADPASDDDVKTILAQWKAARKERSTAYVPASLMYHSVETPSPSDLQLVELQQQASLDIANALGIEPEDLGISTTSRTYQNAVDRRRDRINDVLSPYMRAITDRLSMGDVTRRGYQVAFDLDDYLRANPTERWAMYQTAKNIGAITVEEIRDEERLPPLPAGAEPEPEQTVVVETPQPEQVDASRPASHTFDGPGLTFADVPLETFSVDREGRVIEGLAVPWRAVAQQGGISFRFERGSLQWDAANPGRVKLLRDHDTRQPLGTAIQLKDTPGGLLSRFKVARGAAGDEALALAEDGVLDGLSVGVDFDVRSDTTPDARDRNVLRVQRADLREVSMTAMPSFDGARVTSVAASRTGGGPVPDTETPESETAPETPAPEPAATAPQTFSTEDVMKFWLQREMAKTQAEQPAEERQTVDPTRQLNLSVTREELPYRFDRRGNFIPTEHVFSADLHEMALAGDVYGESDAGKRVMGLLRATFDVDSADVTTLNPNIQRPDMYVDQQDFRYPLWNFINKGAPPNGIQPFTFPKFNTAAGLVADHTQGVEPTSGTFTTTSQTVTPGPVSGKASITREVWDMGGNPAVSTLIFNQMVRGYREALETSTATFLNTLTAAADITLAAGSVDAVLAAAWDAALADLQFVRNYDFAALALEKNLYKAFVAARDDMGRVLYPIVAPSNANGTAETRFRTLDLGGVTGVPSWALPAVVGSPNNSWLFDPMFVHGWATSPQRLEFPGSTQAGAYAPVAFVDVAIWGYKAHANSDIGAVRQVIYDTTL
jgi:HK97 family phage prohead protease